MRLLTVIVALSVAPQAAAARSFWPADLDWQPTLQVGDYVIYRFSGNYTATPFDLKKEVIDKRGDRITVDVVASRGDERRHWIEVVADIQRDVKPATVYELTEIVGASRTRLAVTDIDRLYAWTPTFPVVAPDFGTEVGHLEGWSFECDRTFGEALSNGATVKVRSLTCKDFPWGRWEHAMWDETATVADVKVIETGRGGYSQVDCPPGATPKRAKDFDSIVEACTRRDGTLDGPWSKRDGHGKPLILGQYRAGKKHGLWRNNQFGIHEEHCMFDAGAEVGFVRPWEWTHLRLGLGAGAGVGPGGSAGTTATAQVGWDLWSRKRHCRSAEARKMSKTNALAAVGDIHLFVPETATTTLVRLGLQGYAVRGESRRGYLDNGLFDTGVFASIGMVVTPAPGVGASIGLEWLFGMRLEARYDYVPERGQLVSVTVGLSDGFLVVFD